MGPLFPDQEYTTLSAQSQTANVQASKPATTGQRVNIDMDTQYLLLDLNDRRWSRANNVLGCIVAVIAIIYFIQKIIKN